jgi:hypothetical protein
MFMNTTTVPDYFLCGKNKSLLYNSSLSEFLHYFDDAGMIREKYRYVVFVPASPF